MVTLYVWIALALLVLGVVGSVVPLMPGGLLSLAGVYLHWWASGFTAPETLLLVSLTLLGLLAVAADYGGGAVATRAGGGSYVSTGAAAVVGLVLALLTGPVGLLVGVAVTVFVVEFVRNRDPETSGRTALYATVGVLASSVAQLLFTGTMLVVFVLGVLL